MNKIILGLGYGGEGKGLVTSYFASKDKNASIVKFSCGEPTLESGIAIGNTIYINEDCLLNLNLFMNRYNALVKKGISLNVVIHPNCKIFTIMDSFAYPSPYFQGVFKRNQDGILFKASDILESMSIIKYKTSLIQNYYKCGRLYLDLQIKEVSRFKTFLDNNNFVQIAQFNLIDSSIKEENNIYESSYGLLFDSVYGLCPNKFTVSTGVDNIYNVYYNLKGVEVYLVTRAYCLANDDQYIRTKNIIDEDLKIAKDKAKYSYLDLDLINYGIHQHFEDNDDDDIQYNLVVTCLDHLNVYKLWYQDELFQFDTELDFIQFIHDNIHLTLVSVYGSRCNDYKKLEKY